MPSWSNGTEFENEVRRVARALWDTPPGGGGSQKIDGRERDCIFKTEYVTHYLEITRQNTLDKVRNDALKMVKYRRDEASKGNSVKLWYITEKEPTADQRTEAQKHGITILSLIEFERSIFDFNQYLQLRCKYRFGSASDPDTDSTDTSQTKYQNVAIRRDTPPKATLNIKDVADHLVAGGRAVLLGDYGMGKSITLREVFTELRHRRLNGDISYTPVLLNLREHWGQSRPAEALDRHGHEVGLSEQERQKLIRAFNAKRLIVMLDGFDETASIQWNPRVSPRMREARVASVALANAFIQQSLGGPGLIVAGREHYFDNFQEMNSALGLRDADLRLSLDGFSVEETKSFFASRGIKSPIPEWLPSRPLFLAYLSRKGLLKDILEATDGLAPARAWAALVKRVSEREAAIHSNLGSDSIQRILEHLASTARQTPTGLGPITERDVAAAFQRVTEMEPDEAARPLLMRLPGLSSRDRIEGRRTFLDDDFVDVLRTGDVIRFYENQYDDPSASQWRVAMGPTGLEILASSVRSPESRKDPSRVALAAASTALQKWKSSALAMDLIQAARLCGQDESSVDCNGLVLTDISVRLLDLSVSPIPRNLTLQSVEFDAIYVPDGSPDNLRIVDSVIQRLAGVSRLPEWIIRTDVGTFDEVATNAGILRSDDIPLGLRVGLTMLRKLFEQRGYGRNETALSRGMDPKGRTKVPALLELLKTEGIAFCCSVRGSTVWYPVQGQRRRAHTILDAPTSSRDTFVLRAKVL
jgi:hypothetical protein